MQYFTFLDPRDLDRIHEASLEILNEVGLLVRNAKARRRFAEHGARVDEATERVTMDDSLCEALEGLMAGVEADMAAATRADPSFVPTRYLSTRTAVRLGRVLRAACVLDKISNPSRPLEVMFEDFERLRLSMLLSGPTPEQVASLLGRETDLRERRQLSIMRTEREIFDRALSRVPKPKKVPRAAPKGSVDLVALERAVEQAKPGGDTKALLETTQKIAVAVESGAPGAEKARELLEGTVSSLVERALRKGLLAGAGVGGGTASGHPLEIAQALEELAQGLEKSAGTARPIARWLRGRAIALLDDAASLASAKVGATLEADMPADADLGHYTKRAGEVLAELEGLAGRQLGATLGHLAKGLPIYDLTFLREGGTRVEALGVV